METASLPNTQTQSNLSRFANIGDAIDSRISTISPVCVDMAAGARPSREGGGWGHVCPDQSPRWKLTEPVISLIYI